MDVKDIKDPSFLKDLNINELNKLSTDIRKFLIESISVTGGHLASNLGVVELTIALHKVFDSPSDKIFFDVGHQSYVHKILTGRADRFNALRQYNGLSGFEKRNESIHDVWEAGHSSTSLSAALGMAISRDLNHETYNIIPVIGDGALSSGMALEALNQIGYEQKKVIIIFNDNKMSISKNVGALSHSFNRIRSDKGYNKMKNDLKHALSKNDLTKAVLHGLTNVKDTIKETVIDSGIFKEFDIEYLGPIDGHNFKELLSALEMAKIHDGPIVVHVKTKKGKGYLPCEEDIDGMWHGVGPFNPKTGKFLNDTPNNFKQWSSVLSDKLCDLAATNKDIICLTPAMISGSKLEKFFAKYPDRSFDCGIAEEHAATLAAGLAISGKRPFLSIYSSFMQRCYDQINHDICRMDLPVVIGIDRAGLVGADGDTHHGVFDIGILRSLPNIIIAQPKDSKEAESLLYSAFKQSHPFAIRIPRGAINYEKADDSLIEIGTWTKLGCLNDFSVVCISYGPDIDKIVHKAMINDLKILVINARFIKPIDYKMIDELCSYQKPVVIYETDMLSCGLASSIMEYLCDTNQHLEIHRIGIKDNYVTFGSNNQLRKLEHIDIITLFDLLNDLAKKGVE